MTGGDKRGRIKEWGIGYEEKGEEERMKRAKSEEKRGGKRWR